MPTEPKKPLIVISYAHADEPEHPAEGEVKWLSFVTGYLKPAIKNGAVDLWLDRLMPGGADWEPEIGAKLRACHIFILLVSRHSLSSDYVVDKEIALIRERQARGEAVHFYPLVLTPTPKIALDLVHDKNLRPRDGKPLSDYPLHERYRHMSDAADEIANIATKVAAQTKAKAAAKLGVGRVQRCQARQRPRVASHLRSAATAETKSAAAKTIDAASLEAWLRTQPNDIAVTMAARSALRVVPLVGTASRELIKRQLGQLTEATFRAAALARAVGRYPALTNELRGAANAAAFAAADTSMSPRALGASWAVSAASHAADTALDVASRDEDAWGPGAWSRRAFETSIRAARATAAIAADATFWAEVRADAEASPRDGAATLADRQLWSLGTPAWASGHWAELRAGLPKGQGWDVWIDWYEERLRGGSRGEAYELVFVSVPQEEWDKGPAAANAWIKAHLPKAPEPAPPVELPRPVSNLDAPFAYGWSASQRVAVVAGAQNLPDYRHFSSEEDHRRALEACRVGGERLLKALRDGRYNARPEYGEALEYYLDDLPKTAGAGNILLANDQVRILHAMFLADAAMLPEGFASRLKSVIANQFALNAFYDLVQRHNEAVNAGNWSRPFPLDAAKGFFGAVEDNTPRWFEREVEQGLRQVEQGEPPPAAAPALAPASPIEPPPLPPGTPDAQNSWKRQMATAANALWETFLQGRDMPVNRDEWGSAAEQLGAHVKPIIDFLREQEEPKE